MHITKLCITGSHLIIVCYTNGDVTPWEMPVVKYLNMLQGGYIKISILTVIIKFKFWDTQAKVPTFLKCYVVLLESDYVSCQFFSIYTVN